MAFDEHVKVTMGLNKGPFEKGLKGANSALHVFHGTLGALGVHFGLGAAKHFVESLMDMGRQLTNTSEGLGVSTGFLQGFQHGAEQMGFSAETATGLLDKFVKGLADSGREGADIEEELYKVADAMHATDDPVKRAKIAFDAFGKKAADLIPLLSTGSEGLKKFREEAHKLNAEEIKALDTLDKRLKEAEHNVKVSGGHVVGFFFRMAEAAGAATVMMGAHPEVPFFDRFFQAMGEASVAQDQAADAAARDEEAKRKLAQATEAAAEKEKKLSDAYTAANTAMAETDYDAASAQEQLNIMLSFRKKLLDELAARPDPSVENAKRLVALAKLQKDIGEQQKTVDADRLKIAQQQEQAFEASARLTGAQAAAGEAKKDRSGWTLQDLANMTPQTRAGARNKFLAQQALAAEDFAHQASANGMQGRAEKATDFALGIRKQLEPLTAGERDPLRSMAQDVATQTDALQQILDKASGEGLNVNNRMGQ